MDFFDFQMLKGYDYVWDETVGYNTYTHTHTHTHHLQSKNEKKSNLKFKERKSGD